MQKCENIPIPEEELEKKKDRWIAFLQSHPHHTTSPVFYNRCVFSTTYIATAKKKEIQERCLHPS